MTDIYNPWDLYSSHVGCSLANRLLDAAWDYARTTMFWAEAEQFMLKQLESLSHLGGMDTEPRFIMVRKLAKEYGHHAYEDAWRL